MSDSRAHYAALPGRLLLCLIFVLSAVDKVFNFAARSDQIAQAGFAIPSLMLIGAIVFELAGGVSLAAGFRVRVGATMLIVFLVLASVLFHNFWAYEGEAAAAQMIAFLKNVSILGGLLYVIAFGAGPVSFDNAGPKPVA